MPIRHPYDTIPVDTSQPLADTTNRGKTQPWRQHRDQAQLLASTYHMMGDDDRARRVDNCAPRLVFTADGDGRKTLENAWFCRVRVCPVCQWRRSLKIYGQTTQIVQAAAASRPGGYSWIMLTLTIRNVTGDELPAAITHLHQSWHRLVRTKRWTDTVIGWQRCTEVTHNVDPDSTSYNTYHPHFHALLAVLPSYWHKQYISQADWGKMWASAARLDYDPMIDVRRVKDDTAGAVAEVSKYTTKAGDYLTPWDVDMMIESVRTLSNALHRRRLLAWGGLLKTLHQQLGLDDVEDGDLVHTDNDPTPEAAATKLIAYSWVPGYRQYYREID